MHIAPENSDSTPRFAAQTERDRRFGPDCESVTDAVNAVRALDPVSYQALLAELGLQPDPRLSVPGRDEQRRTAAG